MVSRAASSSVGLCILCVSLALTGCSEDDPEGAPAGQGGTGGSGTAGSGTAGSGTAGSSSVGGQGGAGPASGAGGAAGAAAGSGGGPGGAAGSPAAKATCPRIAAVTGELDTSAFATFDAGLPFCVVGVHAIDGDVTSDYGTVGQLGPSGRLVGALKGKVGYAVWTAPEATPANAKASLGKGTEVTVTADGVPAGAFFATPSGDQSNAYLSYTGAPPEFAGELLQVSLVDGKITAKAAANGLYAVAAGSAPGDFFFTGLSNLGAVKTEPGNNGVYRGTCAAGTCKGKVVKQWGDASGPIDTDENGTVFVAHSTFGAMQVITAFSTTAAATGATVDVLTDANFSGSLAAVQGQLVVAESNPSFAQEPLLFASYTVGTGGAITTSAPSAAKIRPVGMTTLNVVGSESAAGELWVIADSNGFAPAGKTVFIRLERVK